MITIKKRYILLWRFLVLSLLVWWTYDHFGSLESWLLYLVQGIQQHPWAIAIFFALYFIRPFVLLPVGRLSMIAWVLRWRRPWVAIALVGEMVSACIAFAVGRHFGWNKLSQEQQLSFSVFAFDVKLSPFRAVTLSRISPLPDDVINYGRGIVRLDRKHYFRWSLLGNAPFSVLNVAFGTKILINDLFLHGIRKWVNRDDMLRLWIVYVVLLIISMAIMRWLKK